MEILIGIIIGIALCQANDRFHIITKIKGLINKKK